MMKVTLVIFHLIRLNTITDFPEIERQARRETIDGVNSVWTQKQCIRDGERVCVHCGQVLGLVRSLPRVARPPWWAAAIYRVSLILRNLSLASEGSLSVFFPALPADDLALDEPQVRSYQMEQGVLLALTEEGGSRVTLDGAPDVLSYSIK